MSEQFPTAVPDEPAGDLADQASRLQMAEEQEAIRAALAGDVHASDEYEDRPAAIDVLEGPDVTEGDSVDASDDPVEASENPKAPPTTKQGVTLASSVSPAIKVANPFES